MPSCEPGCDVQALRVGDLNIAKAHPARQTGGDL
jgi:hypothetical protein